jgi:hypothetical protein
MARLAGTTVAARATAATNGSTPIDHQSPIAFHHRKPIGSQTAR